MRAHLDPHTGHAVTPEQVPAYLTHPSNAGRVVQLVPVLTFSPPARTADGEPAGTTPGRSLAHQQASHARWS